MPAAQHALQIGYRMSVKGIRAHLLALPELAAWPEVAGFLSRPIQSRLDWDLPVLACRAVGGQVEAAAPGAAAIACMQISIILVDDMLDKDPRGEHLHHGIGPTANLALALQAAAFCVIAQAVPDAERRAAINASLTGLALTTALGQHWDSQNLRGEENYWKVVRAKSTPFYGAALQVGALLGNASPEVASRLYDLGVLVGEVIQIRDDLFDAFQTPANPDWTQGRANLPVLYACTAHHPDRTRLEELMSLATDPERLREAQQILIGSGAVGYCAYHLVKRHRAAWRLLDSIPLADPSPMQDLLARQTQPVVKLLESSGTEVPEELLAG